MSKFSDIKLKMEDSQNQWHENFNYKAGYRIWKAMRIINWLLLLIIIPFLPLVIYSAGFDNTTGLFNGQDVYWGFITTMIIFSLFVITLFVQWWFSRFCDFLEKDEK